MIAYGLCIDALGHGRQHSLAQGEHGPTLRTRSYATPADGVRHEQPSRIPVNVAHDPGQTVGQVAYLERTGKGVWALAEIEDDYVPGALVKVADELVHVETPMYWSTERTARKRDGCDSVIEAIAIVGKPAQIGLEPLTFIDGDLETATPKAVWDSGVYGRELIGRAREYHRSRARRRLRHRGWRIDPGRNARPGTPARQAQGAAGHDPHGSLARWGGCATVVG